MTELIKIETMEPKNRLRIEFMVGNYCNYKCWYCGPYANGGDTRWPTNYDFLLKNFIHLLDFYVANGKNNFEVNLLGGEPALWPNVSKFARDLKESYNVKVTMTTNGSRTLRWWDKNATAFDKILFSYHHKEVKDINEYIEVLDLVYSKGIPINALVLIDPTEYDACVQAIETMKERSKYSWFISAMEVHPPQYTEEQREIFKNHVKRRPSLLRIFKDEYENLLKGKTKAIFNDRTKKKVERNYFSVNNLNNFEGWMCNIGIENINIQKDGKITGTCGNYVYGEERFYNLYDPNFTEIFKPKLAPSLCTKTGCWCQPEMLMTKWKL